MNETRLIKIRSYFI